MRRYCQYVSNSVTSGSEFASVVFVDIEEGCDDDTVGKLATREALLCLLTVRHTAELHVYLTTETHALFASYIQGSYQWFTVNFLTNEFLHFNRQCFDAVGWVAGTASGL